MIRSTEDGGGDRAQPGLVVVLTLAMALPMLVLYAIGALGPQLVTDLGVDRTELGALPAGARSRCGPSGCGPLKSRGDAEPQPGPWGQAETLGCVAGVHRECHAAGRVGVGHQFAGRNRTERLPVGDAERVPPEGDHDGGAGGRAKPVQILRGDRQLNRLGGCDGPHLGRGSPCGCRGAG